MIIAIAKKENFKIDPSSAELIALLGDGSFRDAESILQKVISASKDNKVSPEEVELVTGAPRAGIVNDFIRSIDEGNLELGLGAVSKATELNIDMLLYFRLVLHKMRSILLLRNLKSAEGKLRDELSDSDFNFLKSLADKKPSKINSDSLLTLLNYYDMVAKAYIPELPLELVLVKLIG